MPRVPDAAALPLEAWENAQAEALRGARQLTASAGAMNTVSDHILWFCSREPIGESQAVMLAVSGPAVNLPESRLET